MVDAPPLSELATNVAQAEKGSAPVDFALCLALNHTVVLEEDPKTGKKQMQAESPDEEALVDGGKVRLSLPLLPSASSAFWHRIGVVLSYLFRFGREEEGGHMYKAGGILG